MDSRRPASDPHPGSKRSTTPAVAATEQVLVVKRAKSTVGRVSATEMNSGRQTPRGGGGPGTPKEVNTLSAHRRFLTPQQQQQQQHQVGSKPVITPLDSCAKSSASQALNASTKKGSNSSKVPASAWLSTDDRRTPAATPPSQRSTSKPSQSSASGVQFKLSSFFPRDDFIDRSDSEMRGRQKSREDCTNGQKASPSTSDRQTGRIRVRSTSSRRSESVVAGTEDEDDDGMREPIPEISPSTARRIRKRSLAAREAEDQGERRAARTGVALLLDSSPIHSKREAILSGLDIETPKQKTKRSSQSATGIVTSSSSKSSTTRRIRQTQQIVEEADEQSYRPPTSSNRVRPPALALHAAGGSAGRESSKRNAKQVANERTARMYEAFPLEPEIVPKKSKLAEQSPSSPLPTLTPSSDEDQEEKRGLQLPATNRAHHLESSGTKQEPEVEAESDPETSPYVQSVIVPPQIREAHLRLVPGGELYVAEKREEASLAEAERKRTMFREQGEKLVESDDDDEPHAPVTTPRKKTAGVSGLRTPQKHATPSSAKQVTPSRSILRTTPRSGGVRSDGVRSRSVSFAPITPTKPMRDEVQTLAVWSPYRGGETQYAMSLGGAARQSFVGPSDAAERGGGLSHRQDLAEFADESIANGPNTEHSSQDEIIEGSLPESTGYRLIESIHPTTIGGKATRVNSAGERQSKRARFVASPFSQVSGAWAGVRQDDSSTPKLSTASKNAKSDSKTSIESQQASLAAFGFSKESKRKRRAARAFETDFKDEIELAEEHDDQEVVSSSQTQVLPNLIGLGRLPSPPTDPRLQPAGLRAMRQRQQAVETGATIVNDKDSELIVVPSSQASERPENELSFSDPSLHSSDFARSDDAPSLSASLNDWWQEIEGGDDCN